MTINEFNFAGKKAIVRVDFNVPLDENGKITDDTRIRGALPTLKKVLNDGGALIIMSHMGKPKGKVNPKFSLGQIKDAVAEALGAPVAFAPDCAKAQEAAAALKPGEVLLLENLRFVLLNMMRQRKPSKLPRKSLQRHLPAMLMLT